MEPVDALTEPDPGETDATPAAEAARWLRRPSEPFEPSAMLSLIEQWESEPEWTPDQAPEPTPDQEDECRSLL